MKALIAYYSKSASPEKVALAIKEEFEAKGHKVELRQIVPKQKLKEYEYNKMNEIELKNKDFDVSGFDLVVVGTPVWTFNPSKVVMTFLRKLNNTEQKNFGLYCTCILPGNTIKKMSNVLTTKGAKVVHSVSIQSIFEVDSYKLKEARSFALRLLERMGKKPGKEKQK